MESNLLNQIQSLQSHWIHPPICPILKHISENGNIAPCCHAAQVAYHHEVQNSSHQHGLLGVLEYLHHKFKWGLICSQYYCECMTKYAHELSCDIMTKLAMEALSLYLISSNSRLSDEPIELYWIEIISQNSEQESKEWRTDIINNNQNSKYSGTGGWIEDNCHYHMCIGIQRPNNGLFIWDFDTRYLFLKEYGASNGILSIRAIPYHDLKQSIQVLNWDGIFEFPVNQWVLLENNSKLVQNYDECSKADHLYKIASASLMALPCTPPPPPPAGMNTSILCSSTTTPTDNDFTTINNYENDIKQQLQIFITGVQTSCNPCAGVGVARALRVQYPYAKLIAIDAKSGLVDIDPIFSDAHVCHELGSNLTHANATNSELWQAIVELLINEYPQAFFLPCRDHDVNILSAGKEVIQQLLLNNNTSSSSVTVSSTNTDSNYKDVLECLSATQLESLMHRILCPTWSAIEVTHKPAISALSFPCFQQLFQIPIYKQLNEDASMTDALHFIEQTGYPILLKGPSQGGVLCWTWLEVCNCLAAYPWTRRGFLQKYIPGIEKCFLFTAYQGEFLGSLQLTKRTTTTEGKIWAGDLCSTPDEIEVAIKDLYNSPNGRAEVREIEVVQDLAGVYWAIDFNPRFPAWSFASAYLNNLPALLLKYALAVRSFSEKNGHGILPILSSDTTPSSLSRISFTRTLVEVPISSNSIQCSQILTRPLSSVGSMKGGKGNIVAISNNHGYLPLLSTSNKTNTHQYSPPLIEQLNDHQIICDTSLTYLKSCKLQSLRTPIMCLQNEVIIAALKRQKKFIYDVIGVVQTESLLKIHFQAFLSIKTQPHNSVVTLAKQYGYYAECISLAEVHHCLNCGYIPSEIILTGPGKFWTGMDNWDPSTSILSTTPLRCIFADSIEDLKVIVEKINDSNHWCKATYIGLRWAPVNVASRFGLKCTPESIQVAAEILSTLSPHYEIGMQFHYASSNLSAVKWFEHIEAFCTFCHEFSLFTGRRISIIDFGGGFNPYVLVSEESKKSMRRIIRQVTHLFQHQVNGLPVLQLEPGKSISEPAGFIIARILAIRVINSFNGKDQKAMIIDAHLGQISSPHIHTMYYLPANTIASLGTSNEWIRLESGPDELWGRTCMEFDKVWSPIHVPDEVAVGDFILITATGAYDMSMQYDFGDGLARQMTVIGGGEVNNMESCIYEANADNLLLN